MGKAITFLAAALVGAAILTGPASAVPMTPDAVASSPVETVQYYGGGGGYGPGYGRGGYGRGYGRPRGARPGAVVRDLLGVGPRRGYRRGYGGRPGYGRGYRGY